MRIYLDVSSEALEAQLREQLEAGSHLVSARPHEALVLLIDDGHADLADRIARVRASQPAIEAVLICDPGRLESLPGLVSDFMLRPVLAAELEARLQRIARRRISAGTRYEDLLAMAVEATGDVIEITDPESVLQYVNPAFERVMGISPEDAIGKTPAQLFRSAMHSPEYFAQIEATLSSGRVWKGLLISKRADGRLIYLQSVIAPVHDVSGRATHRIAVKRDVTASKVAEAELRASNEALSQARDAAIEASRVKSQFVANMSHELRTPLNAILGYAELLEEDLHEQHNPEVVEDVARIRKAGLHLLSLVNDVLDLSKIEAGHTELHLEEIELEPLLTAVIQTMDPLVNDRRNQLAMVFECDHGALRTDLVKLRQCVLNLVSNANKFTEQGRITVRARNIEAPQGQHGAWVEIEVADTGIGMTPQEQGRLFQPFVQADASTTRRFGGTGLGLHISQRFCEMLGGRIFVSSEAGVGSSFRMQLPVWLSERRAKRLEASQVQGAGPGALVMDLRPQVLLIDDDRKLHDLLESRLDRLGYDLIAFEHGTQGLRHVRLDPPDLILLDVQMPGMDGWAVFDSLAKDPAAREIPVVMLSIGDHEARALECGAKAFLAKPVRRDALSRVLKAHCPTRSSGVLLFEESAGSSRGIVQTLDAAGHRVVRVSDPQAALEALATGRFDLLLLDLVMTKLDGLEFLRLVRERPGGETIPIVVTTAKVLARDEMTRLDHVSATIVSKNAYSERELAQLIARELLRTNERTG